MKISAMTPTSKRMECHTDVTGRSQRQGTMSRPTDLQTDIHTNPITDEKKELCDIENKTGSQYYGLFFFFRQ